MNNNIDINTLYGFDKTNSTASPLQLYNYPSENSYLNNNNNYKGTQLNPAEQVIVRDNIPITHTIQANSCAQCSSSKQNNTVGNKKNKSGSIPSPIRAKNNEEFVLIESHAGLTETPVTILQDRNDDYNNTDKNFLSHTQQKNNTEMGVANMNSMNTGMVDTGNNSMGIPANISGSNANSMNTNLGNGVMGANPTNYGIGTGNIGASGINSGVSGLDQNILTGTGTAELGLFLRNLLESIQSANSQQSYSVSQESLQYLNGYLRTQIGKLMEIEFLIGTNTTVIKRGYLTTVGANYLILQDINSRQMTICDFYNIKFATFYR